MLLRVFDKVDRALTLSVPHSLSVLHYNNSIKGCQLSFFGRVHFTFGVNEAGRLMKVKN